MEPKICHTLAPALSARREGSIAAQRGTGASGIRVARGGKVMKTAEELRLEESKKGTAWRRWGPYLSERQWGTVREDYSADGNAWEYFPHDQARSRAYHWGEDGLGGISDDKQHLCFAIALWKCESPNWMDRTGRNSHSNLRPSGPTAVPRRREDFRIHKGRLEC
jgi:hypothetical protein